MEIKELLTIILFAVLMALNIVAFDRIGRLRNELEELEEDAKRVIEQARINSQSISAVSDCYKELKEQFEKEISENLEASAEKSRKEAEAQEIFNEGLKSIINFDGGVKAKGDN